MPRLKRRVKARRPVYGGGHLHQLDSSFDFFGDAWGELHGMPRGLVADGIFLLCVPTTDSERRHNVEVLRSMLAAWSTSDVRTAVYQIRQALDRDGHPWAHHMFSTSLPHDAPTGAFLMVAHSGPRSSADVP